MNCTSFAPPICPVLRSSQKPIEFLIWVQCDLVLYHILTYHVCSVAVSDRLRLWFNANFWALYCLLEIMLNDVLSDMLPSSARHDDAFRLATIAAAMITGKSVCDTLNKCASVTTNISEDANKFHSNYLYYWCLWIGFLLCDDVAMQILRQMYAYYLI